MEKCPYCGKELHGEDKCPRCYAELPKKEEKPKETKRKE